MTTTGDAMVTAESLVPDDLFQAATLSDRAAMLTALLHAARVPAR